MNCQGLHLIKGILSGLLSFSKCTADLHSIMNICHLFTYQTQNKMLLDWESQKGCALQGWRVGHRRPDVDKKKGRKKIDLWIACRLYVLSLVYHSSMQKLLRYSRLASNPWTKHPFSRQYVKSKIPLQCVFYGKQTEKGKERENPKREASLTSNAVLWTSNCEKAMPDKSVFLLSFGREGYLITFRYDLWLVDLALWWIGAPMDSLLSSSSPAREREERGKKKPESWRIYSLLS